MGSLIAAFLEMYLNNKITFRLLYHFLCHNPRAQHGIF